MQDTESKALDQFIEEHGITAEVEYADENPNMTDASPDMRHWLVTLRRTGYNQTGPVAIPAVEMKVPFSQGAAHTEEPTAADVLDCLASDVSSVENEPDFLAWARDMGYESIEDAERARKTHETIQRQAISLLLFLGENEAAYDELLWNVERL